MSVGSEPDDTAAAGTTATTCSRHPARRARPGWRAWAPAALLAAAVLGVGCDRHAAPSLQFHHPWIHPPQVTDKHAVELPHWLIYRVASGLVAEAAGVLRQQPYVQVSPHVASYYAGQDIRVPAEMRPFLIRGLDAGHSDISVIQSLQGLWVRVRGGDGRALREQPLIVLVDPTPIDIFVTVEPAPMPGTGTDDGTEPRID